MVFWPLYMYSYAGLKLTEMFVLGSFLLPIALLFNIRKPIIKRLSLVLLLLYTIFVAVFGAQWKNTGGGSFSFVNHFR